MPRVTALEPSERPRGWVDVHLDGAFVCRLPRRGAEEEGVAVGTELDRRELEAIRDRAQGREALDAALRYLAHRPRSRFEVERRLRREGYVASAVSAAVSRCLEMGYLDDREFAAAWARDRIRLRPRSPVLIEAELRRRGVSPGDARAGIAAALDDEEVSEDDLLRRAAERASRRVDRADREVARRRILGYLARRGFRGVDARAAVERILERGSEPSPGDRSPGDRSPGTGGPGARRPDARRSGGSPESNRGR